MEAWKSKLNSDCLIDIDIDILNHYEYKLRLEINYYENKKKQVKGDKEAIDLYKRNLELVIKILVSKAIIKER